MPRAKQAPKVSDAQLRTLSLQFNLAERETDVFRAILDHADEAAIAESLGVRDCTARTYTYRLYRLLSVNDRTGMLRRVAGECAALAKRGHPSFGGRGA